MNEINEINEIGSDRLAQRSLAWMTILVDASSSMATIASETVESLQSFIAAHAGDRDTRVSLVQFSSQGSEVVLSTLFDTAAPTARVSGLVHARGLATIDYRPGGGTPLLTAVMSSIDRLEKWVTPADRALLVIATDGCENSSRGVTFGQVKARIEAKRKLGNWTFAFLGAELDAWKTGETMGIDRLAALTWSPTAAGVRAAFQTTSDAAGRWRKAPRKALGAHFYPLQLPPPKEIR